MRPALRAHLQSALTLSVAALVLLVGWAGVAEFPWWTALGLEPQLWWHVIPLILMAAALLLRIRRPVLALLLGGVIVLVDLSIGVNVGILLCLSDLVYSLGIRGSRRAVRITGGVLGLITIGIGAAGFLAGVEWRSAVSLSLAGMAVLLMPLWWSWEVRRGYPLWQEADARGQLEAERHANVLRAQARKRHEAVEEERRSMARELHDVVSSQVSAIALSSGAVLNAPAESARDREALRTIRITSVEALEQLREMVQLLRGETVDPASGTALEAATWDQVIARARQHGLQFAIDGQPPDGLSPTVRHVLLRILQEALTNALKHGDGSASIGVRTRRRRLLLQVSSGLRQEEGDVVAVGSGTGLTAMRERAEMLGGTLRAGPSRGDEKTWLLRAKLPLKEQNDE